MAVKKVIKTDIPVKVTVDASIFLTITVGNAQIGGNVVRWKNSPTILAKGEITNLNLGLGMDIRGRTLKITTNVLDVNPMTNGIVINHFFFFLRGLGAETVLASLPSSSWPNKASSAFFSISSSSG